MTDERRAGILLAKRVIDTLSAIALANTTQEMGQAYSLYDAACQDWDRWRRPNRRLLPDWSAGPAGAADYLQHMAFDVNPNL